MNSFADTTSRQVKQRSMQYYPPRVINYENPTELDYLLNDIVTCTPGSAKPSKIISYLGYYYPKLKDVRNVKLLTANFLRCPLFFSSIQCMTLTNMTSVIEVFQYIMITKFKISNPTVSFHEFYSAVYETIREQIAADSTAYWKVIPILAGCVSSKSFMEDYNPYPAYNNVIQRLHVQLAKTYSESLLCIYKLNFMNELKVPFTVSLLYMQEYVPSSFYRKVAYFNSSILQEITETLFTASYGLDRGALLYTSLSYDELIKTTPALRYLNRWVFVYGKVLNAMPPTVPTLHSVLSSLEPIVTFSSNICDYRLNQLRMTDKWDLMKYTFFSIVMFFEHVTNLLVSGKCPITGITFISANKILKTFFNLSFVLDQIGTGGFDTYNYVFQSTSYLLSTKSPDSCEILEYSLLNGIPSSGQALSPLETSKLDCFLHVTEAVLSSLKDSFKITTLFPLLTSIFTSPNSASSTIEVGHSIMMAHLKSVSKAELAGACQTQLHDIVYPYLDKVLAQFPSRLSLLQTSTIVSTCAQVSASDPEFIRTLTDLILFHVKLSAYVPLPARTSHVNDEEVILPEPLQTRRAGLVSFMIDTLQFTHVLHFETALSQIKANIDCLVGDRDIYALYDMLWEKLLMINKYDVQKGQMGLDWWYDTVNAGLVPKL